jgi:AbrB family looped-hinge helix DNA binding protein
MPTATLTSKGQITIPLSLRVALGLQAGTKLDFVQTEDGFKVVPLRHAGAILKGRFAGRVDKPVSFADMDEAIASEAAARHASVIKAQP